MQTGHDGVVDVAFGHAGVLERGREGLAGERHVELLAEALLPHVRVGLARDAPAVEELVAGRAAPDQLRHGAVGRAHEGRGAVAAVALLGRAGQTGAQVRDDGERGAAGPGRRLPNACSSVPTAERDEPAKS